MKYKINEKFFSRWSRQMAWMLGWVYSDGGIVEQGSSKRLVFNIKDLDVLEKFNKLMNSNIPIKKYFDKRYDPPSEIYTLNICRKKIVDDLRLLGVTPRKSKTMIFPKVPYEYLKDFIRGCFEGDGSYCPYSFKHGKKMKIQRAINVNYTSGSYKFIIGMQEVLKHLGYTSRLYKINSVYRLNIHGSRKFLSMLYHYVRPYMTMDRKRLISQRYLFPSGFFDEQIKVWEERWNNKKVQDRENWKRWWSKQLDIVRKKKISMGQVYKRKSMFT